MDCKYSVTTLDLKYMREKPDVYYNTFFNPCILYLVKINNDRRLNAYAQGLDKLPNL